MSEWEENDLLKIRQILLVHNTEEIENILIRYAEMLELFSANFPHWKTSNKVDWSIAVAMAPNWYDFIYSFLSNLISYLFLYLLLYFFTFLFHNFSPHLFPSLLFYLFTSHLIYFLLSSTS